MRNDRFWGTRFKNRVRSLYLQGILEVFEQHFERLRFFHGRAESNQRHLA